MSQKIEIHKKFKPLFNEDTRYYIITGERGSSKSFTVNLWLTLKMMQENQTVLFTRYTLVSTQDSIIPEFNEKIELLNLEEHFDVQQRDIYSKVNNSRILFRGIKTSQGIQTAKLKSLTDVNIWILDEAEELDSEDEFDKIDLSIRSKKSKNIVVLILNPATRQHWIYKRFFKDRVSEDFNGSYKDTTYIYMTLEDNIKNLDNKLVEELMRLKDSDLQKYKKRVQSSWLDESEDIVFNNEQLNFYEQVDYSNAEIVAYCDVADQGIDYLCFVVGAIIDRRVFIIDVVHTQMGSENSEAMVISKFEKYNIGKAIFESNNQGLMYTKSLIKDAPHLRSAIKPIPNSTNKHSRIVVQHDYIEDNFYFKKTNDKMYNKYLEHLTMYRYDKSFKIDDAPDATAGLAKYLRKVILK